MAKETITEIEVCVRLGIATRTILNRRKAGKMPPHFTVKGKTIYYWLTDIEALEASLKDKGVK